MRKLTKQVLPTNIANKLAEWSEELNLLLQTGEEIPDLLANRYRWSPLKKIISSETCGKCAYCESKIGHVYPGDVEHILPKKHRPELRFDHLNLTLACFECNNRKSDYYSVQEPILNPYEDDPEKYLMVLGPLIWSLPNNRRAEITERLLGLNRDDLVERRKERLDGIRRLVERYITEPLGVLKDLLRKELEAECGECSEYSFVVRACLLMHYGQTV